MNASATSTVSGQSAYQAVSAPPCATRQQDDTRATSPKNKVNCRSYNLCVLQGIG